MISLERDANDLWREFGKLIDMIQSVFSDTGEVWGRYCIEEGIFVIRILPKDREEAFLHIIRPEDLSLRNADTPLLKARIIKAIYDTTYEALDEYQEKERA